MSHKIYRFEVPKKYNGIRLDQGLSDLLSSALGLTLSKAKVRKVIVIGAVYLNGRRVRIASKPLIESATLEVHLDVEKLNSNQPEQDVEFIMNPQLILFEDDDLIVVNKPAGIPTQPTVDNARVNLYSAVKKFLTNRHSREIYLGLHHRLDRDTSGVLLFTKRREANSGIAKQFSSHTLTKTYQALSWYSGKVGAFPAAQWVVKNYLGRVSQMGKKSQFGSVRSGGDFAETSFQLLQQCGDYFWIQAQPRTGRTHQIRVHLSEGGLPILGDTLYGGCQQKKLSVSRLMLHAACLTFQHPIHQNEISIKCALPGDFNQCLRSLQSLESQHS